MRTLFEEVYRSANDNHKAYMEMAEVVRVQNVADYIYSLEQEYFNVTSDFPNLAPPFPVFWMEFSIPDKLYDGERFRDVEWHDTRFGFLFMSQEIGEDNLYWDIDIVGFIKPGGKAREDGRGEAIEVFHWDVGIDKNGGVAKDFSFRAPHKANLTTEERLEIEVQAEGWAYNMLCPCLLAISFLHCKNVHIISHSPRVAGRRPRRYEPKIRFHTLQIEPMKKILRDEGGSEKTGIKHALHICRGHFKDFTKGKGLFGRYKEIYWWDSQVRGSGIKGAVLKDYSVDKPAE